MTMHELQQTLDRHDGVLHPPKPKPVKIKLLKPPKPPPPPPEPKPAYKGLMKPTVPPRKPVMKREKQIFKIVMAIIALKAQGLKHKEIAEQLGITEDNIKSYLYRANARGQLNMTMFADPEDQMDVIIKSKVMRNIDKFLDQNDKAVTLETLKIMNPVQRQEQPVQQNAMVLQVKVELPQAMQRESSIQVREGTIGGSIARGIPVDAEVIEQPE